MPQARHGGLLPIAGRLNCIQLILVPDRKEALRRELEAED
jgi:hypothetical protein